MRKIILAALVVASLFASCSSEKTFKKKDGSTITAKPYGWASKENKVEGVNYELNAPDIVIRTSRAKGKGWNIDKNGFLCSPASHITHWKPIEKLEW